MSHKCDQLLILCKHPCKYLWKHHLKCRQQKRKSCRHGNNPAVCLFHPVQLPCAKIVAEDWLYTLGKSVDRRARQLHDALQDRQ